MVKGWVLVTAAFVSNFAYAYVVEQKEYRCTFRIAGEASPVIGILTLTNYNSRKTNALLWNTYGSYQVGALPEVPTEWWKRFFAAHPSLPQAEAGESMGDMSANLRAYFRSKAGIARTTTTGISQTRLSVSPDGSSNRLEFNQVVFAERPNLELSADCTPYTYGARICANGKVNATCPWTPNLPFD